MRKTTRRFILALSLCLAGPVQADTLVDHLNGLTLNENGDIERFTGILIGNDGRILQLLHRGDKRPTKLDYAVDAKGRSAIPGFILAHGHILDMGFAELAQETGKAPPANAKPRPEDRDLALQAAQKLMLQNGITTATDMGTTIEDWQVFRRSGDNGTLQIRIIAYAKGAEAMVLIGGPGPTPWLYEDHLRLNGIALTLDASLAKNSAKLPSPSLKRTPPQLNEIQLKNLMSRAAMDHFQVAIEAHSDAAIAQSHNAISELSATYTGDRRWRIEKADVLAAVPNRFALMADAMTGSGTDSQPFTEQKVLERRDLAQALAALTTSPAYAAFAEARVGHLAPGMRADFLLIDTNLQLAAPSQIRSAKVLQTWVGGKIVYAAQQE